MDVWPRRASFQKQAKHVSWPPLKHHEAETLSSMQSLSRIETPILKRNTTCQTFSWCSSGNQARQFQKCRFLPVTKWPKSIKFLQFLLSISRINRPPQKKKLGKTTRIFSNLFQWNQRKCFFLFKSNKPQPQSPTGVIIYYYITNQGQIPQNYHTFAAYLIPGPIEWPNP